MSTLLAQEAALYETMWASVDTYGERSPGELYLPIFQSLVAEAPRKARTFTPTLLDAGTGSGKAAVLLAQDGYRVTACDLTLSGLTPEARAADIRFHEGVCLWHDLRPLTGLWQSFDWVYCCDVLEHIPTQFVGLTVQRLLEVTGLGLFLSVGLEPDNFGAWVGQHLHQTVQPFTWWRDTLSELGTVVNARDLHLAATFLVVPR